MAYSALKAQQNKIKYEEYLNAQENPHRKWFRDEGPPNPGPGQNAPSQDRRGKSNWENRAQQRVSTPQQKSESDQNENWRDKSRRSTQNKERPSSGQREYAEGKGNRQQTSGRNRGNEQERGPPGGASNRHQNRGGGAESWRDRQDKRQGRDGGGQSRGGGQNRNDRSKQGENQGSRNQPKKQRHQIYKYEPHWKREDVQRGLKRGELIEGALRINPRNYEDGYVPHPDGVSDVYISGMSDRNRAMNGDIVAVQLYPRSEWKVFLEDLNLASDDLAVKFKELNLHNDECAPKSPREEDTEGPDVVIEEEYISGDSDNESSSKSEGENLTKTDKVLKNINGASNVDKTDTSHSVENKVVAEKQGSRQAPQKKGATPQGKGPTPQGEGATPKGKPTANTPKKRFTPLKHLVCHDEHPEESSDAVKQLFVPGTPGNKGTTEHKEKKMDAVPDKLLLRTGKIVSIIERKHSRACSGNLKKMKDSTKFALFCPVDSRIPRMLVPLESCPKGFNERPKDFETILFIARIVEWKENDNYACGELCRSLGEAGDIEPETEAMLCEYGVDDSEFPEEAIQCLPQVDDDNPWRISAEEYSKRKDFRKDCVFTIDPSTARDLDDALHINYLGGGEYEVGVHIADVSYFVNAFTPLDSVAESRATSVYLIQKVVPMLPRLLCERLCSLNPDEDRLTFSVVWRMNEEGRILAEPWFGRSVIRSCCKLSYEHAQGFIEDPDKDWTVEELPPISDGYNIPQIKQAVLNLHKVAQHLRKKRFDEGALRLDQVKLSFTLDGDSRLPNGYYVYQQRESNRLVEEFMLLANMSVAHKIYTHYPEIAVLRMHPPPQTKQIDDLVAVCNSLGVYIDPSTSGSLARSIAELAGPSIDDKARIQIMTVLCSKPMQNALYFCTGCIKDEALYRHYALNVPLYTHFTSPIRRYPDIMVHRLLGAALGYCDPPKSNKNQLKKVCDNCNDKKRNAKLVSDASGNLFFSVFVKECGPLEERGMVMGVLNKAFDVLVLKLGVVKRVYCEQLPLRSFNYHLNQKSPELHLVWEKSESHPTPVEQKITIFTQVTCRLESTKDSNIVWQAKIKHPNEKLYEDPADLERLTHGTNEHFAKLYPNTTKTDVTEQGNEDTSASINNTAEVEKPDVKVTEETVDSVNRTKNGCTDMDTGSKLTDEKNNVSNDQISDVDIVSDSKCSKDGGAQGDLVSSSSNKGNEEPG